MNPDARAIGAIAAGVLILGGYGLYGLARYRHQQTLVAGGPSQGRELSDGDLLYAGRLRLMVVADPTGPKLAVHDIEAPARTVYQGLHYFPYNSEYTTQAALSPGEQKGDQPVARLQL